MEDTKGSPSVADLVQLFVVEGEPEAREHNRQAPQRGTGCSRLDEVEDGPRGLEVHVRSPGNGEAREGDGERFGNEPSDTREGQVLPTAELERKVGYLGEFYVVQDEQQLCALGPSYDERPRRGFGRIARPVATGWIPIYQTRSVE